MSHAHAVLGQLNHVFGAAVWAGQAASYMHGDRHRRTIRYRLLGQAADQAIGERDGSLDICVWQHHNDFIAVTMEDAIPHANSRADTQHGLLKRGIPMGWAMFSFNT